MKSMIQVFKNVILCINLNHSPGKVRNKLLSRETTRVKNSTNLMTFKPLSLEIVIGRNQVESKGALSHFDRKKNEYSKNIFELLFFILTKQFNLVD